jgi:hypothetical protein
MMPSIVDEEHHIYIKNIKTRITKTAGRYGYFKLEL